MRTQTYMMPGRRPSLKAEKEGERKSQIGSSFNMSVFIVHYL